MMCISVGGRLLAMVALIASAVKIAQGDFVPLASDFRSRQDSSNDNPETSRFLRRSGGVVAVLGDRIYYDGGSVSQTGPLERPPHSPSNSTLFIDLSTSWSPDTVSISEIIRPNPPSMGSQAVMTDKTSQCFYVWGGYSHYGIPVSSPPELWRLCDRGENGRGDRGAWEKVDLRSSSDFSDYPGLAHSAYATANNAGFAFGGRRYTYNPLKWEDTSSQYMSFNFTTKAWAAHNFPGPLSSTDDPTLWGARAVFVPNYGPNGLIFLFGGVSGDVKDPDAYPTFTSVRFMDPVRRVWYEQKTTATDEGFPNGRHGHCVVGVAGTDNTYEIYMFGGANNNRSIVYDSVDVLSLPSFTWSRAARVNETESRYGQACAVVGNSQLLTWGGLPWGDWQNTYLVSDPFKQGLGIFDLNTLEWASGYNASAAPYRAHPKVVYARYTQPTPAAWSTDDVRELFETPTTGAPVENVPGPSPTPTGAIVGGVVGGLALTAIAAAIWFFVSRRRKARTSPPTDRQIQDPASALNQEDTVPERVSPKFISELHEHSQPAEMTGQGKDPPRQVHEMDGGHTIRP